MENFEIERIMRTINNKKMYIALIIILTVVIGYIYSYYYVVPKYKASTTIILAKSVDSSETTTETITQSDITLNQKLVSTYSQILKSSKVLSSVIDELNLGITENELQSKIQIEAINSTEILKITVIDRDPELVAITANGLVKAFEQEVTNIYNINNVNVIDMAKEPSTPYNINHTKDIAISFIVGLTLAIMFLFLVYLFDTSIKIEEDIEQFVGINVLTTIPRLNNNKKNKENKKKEIYKELITYEDVKSPISEAFRTLRTNIVFTRTDKKIKTILVTSSYTSEGKSWISSNMAVTFAQSNKKVLLIDCDMRKGRQHNIFNVTTRPGLSNCLTMINDFGSVKDISNYIKETTIPNLHIMTGGDRPSNPSELLSSKKMEILLSLVNQMYDVIILDGTPNAIVSDSLILSRIVDSTIVVTAYKETKIGNVKKVKKLIENAGGKIGGAIINKMPVSQKVYQNKYYYKDVEENELIQQERPEGEVETVEQLLARLNANVEQNKKLIKSNDEVVSKRQEASLENSINAANVVLNTDVLEDKIENINTELGTIKNIFAQVLINSQNQLKDSVTSKTQINSLRENLKDLKDLCKNIEEIQSSETFKKATDEIRQRIIEVKESYKSLDDIDKQRRDILDAQISKLQEEYIKVLDDKFMAFNRADSFKEIKEKFNNLQNFIGLIVTDNNSKAEITALNRKLDEIQNIYGMHEESLDKRFEEIKNAYGTHEENLDKRFDEIKNTYGMYENNLDEKLNDKLNKMESRIIESNKKEKIEKLKHRLDAIRGIYSKELEVKLKDLEEKLSNKELLENVEDVDTKVEKLEEQLSTYIKEDVVRIEEKLLELRSITEQNDKIIDKSQIISDNIGALDKKMDELQEKIQESNNSSEILELKTELESMKVLYTKEFIELQEVYSNELKELKDSYSEELKQLSQDYKEYSNTDEIKSEIHEMRKELLTFKEVLDDVKYSKDIINKSYNNESNNNVIKIDQIRNESNDHYMTRMNDKQIETQSGIYSGIYGRNKQRPKKGFFNRREEKSVSLFAVRQSLKEDYIEPYHSTKNTSVSQILNSTANDDSQVM